MQNWVDEQILYFSASSGALGFSAFSGGAVKASSATNSPIKAIARPTAPNTLVAVTKVNGARQPKSISAIPNSMLLIDFIVYTPLLLRFLGRFGLFGLFGLLDRGTQGESRND